MRYFRFLARFGIADPDAEAYRTCIAKAHSLMALSRERIADELLKLLATADPVPALRLMTDGGIFTPIIPEIAGPRVERVARLIARDKAAGLYLAAVRRPPAPLPPPS